MSSANAAPLSQSKNFLAGGFGGMCLVFAGHPFDTVKVRLQTMPQPPPGVPPLFTGAVDCFTKTLRNEGIRGFYKGMGTPVMMVTPLFALAFFGYGLGKKIVTAVQPGELTPVKLFFAGSFAGFATAFAVAPVERIKCLLQIQLGQPNGQQGGVKYTGPVHCAKTLLTTGGISSLYRGFGATFIRAIPQNALYFVSYDLLKKSLATKDSNELSPIRTLTAGGLTGLINWIFILPLDVIKNRIQAAPDGTYPRGFRDALPRLLKEDGPKGLYRGFVPVFIRAFPANAACFMGFEVAVKFLNWAAPEL